MTQHMFANPSVLLLIVDGLSTLEDVDDIRILHLGQLRKCDAVETYPKPT